MFTAHLLKTVKERKTKILVLPEPRIDEQLGGNEQRQRYQRLDTSAGASSEPVAIEPLLGQLLVSLRESRASLLPLPATPRRGTEPAVVGAALNFTVVHRGRAPASGPEKLQRGCLEPRLRPRQQGQEVAPGCRKRGQGQTQERAHRREGQEVRGQRRGDDTRGQEDQLYQHQELHPYHQQRLCQERPEPSVQAVGQQVALATPRKWFVP